MKSPTIHRVLVYAGRKGIPGWWPLGSMWPTPQSVREAHKNINKSDQKHCCVVGLEKTFHRTLRLLKNVRWSNKIETWPQ